MFTGDWETKLERLAATTVTTPARVSYRQAGRGADVVLLHGIGSGAGSWVHQLDALATRYRLTAWDAPGYGDSEPLPAFSPSADVYADALRGLLDALAIEQCVLVGHSLGAIMAARFARRWPNRLRGLLLADPAAGHAALDREERKRRLAERIRVFQDLGAARHAEQRAPRLLAPGAGEAAVGLVRWNMARLADPGYLQAARLLANSDIRADIADISVPAAVACGNADTITPPDTCRGLADMLPGGVRYHGIDGAGHASYIDRPDAFTQLLEEFIEELP